MARLILSSLISQRGIGKGDGLRDTDKSACRNRLHGDRVDLHFNVSAASEPNGGTAVGCIFQLSHGSTLDLSKL